MKTQGQRANDFCFCENELLTFGSECDGEKVDGHCGCKRSMVGLTSRRATTTIEVAEVPLDEEEFINQLMVSERKAGFNLSDKQSRRVACGLIKLAGKFPVGCVLERRGNIFRRRL
jgi:hypothetical protein